MSGPWEKFQQQSAGDGPWAKFQAPAAEQPGGVSSFLAGTGKGVGSTALTLQQYVGKALKGISPDTSAVNKAGQWLVDDAESGKRNLATELAPYESAHPLAAGAGDLAGGIAATWPVGGMIGKGIAALANAPRLAGAAPQITKLAKAIETSGFKTGAPLAADAGLGARAADLLTRSAGGAITGAASASLAAPDHIERGALIGAVLPPGLIGAAKLAKYGGKVAKSVIQPFTEKGQESIAADIIQRFGEGGPMAVNAAELVPGSMPTLAEATGNAGLATLQRGVRDLRPNAFVEREAGNAGAREAAFDAVAGDPAAIKAAVAARQGAADDLYGQAFAADAARQEAARSSQKMRAPFAGVGLSAAPEDLATPGLRELMARPMFQQAAQAAKQLAANRGVQLKDPLQSLEGLHYIKLALDDALNPTAKTAMGRNASAAVMDMRDKLADELAEVSPLYGNARQTFAEMSEPINAMEALQGLRLTDARGNMTLAKVKTGIEGLQRMQATPGISPAKSITYEQMEALKNIHADLLRQDMLNKGRSAGSNTFQNIATDNILTSLLPGTVGEAVRSKAGGVLGQVGKIAYSGPNEAIRSRLTDMMLTPEMVEAILARQRVIPGPNALERFLQMPGVGQSALRVAPVALDR